MKLLMAYVIRLVLVASVLCVATPSFADRDSRWLTGALIAYGTAQGMDLSITMWCIGAQTCQEANPLFRPFTRSPLLAGATKMALAGVTTTVLVKQRKKRPKLVFGIASGLAATYIFVAIRNKRVLTMTVSF